MKIAGLITSRGVSLADAAVSLRIGNKKVADDLRSDDSGRFIYEDMDHYIGQILYVEVNKGSYHPKTLSPITIDRDDIWLGQIDLSPHELTIRGSVKSDGRSVPRATIWLRLGIRELPKLSSDEEGSFEHLELGDFRGQTLTCRTRKWGYTSEEHDMIRRIDDDLISLDVQMIRSWWKTFFPVLQENWKIIVGAIVAVILLSLLMKRGF